MGRKGGAYVTGKKGTERKEYTENHPEGNGARDAQGVALSAPEKPAATKTKTHGGDKA